MKREIKVWGENVWEDKIKEQGETGVIDGSIYSKKKLLKRTDKERNFIESNFLNYIKQKGTILDLGIGPMARFSIFFSKKGYKVTGVDISPTTINYARENIKKAGTEIKLVQDNLATLKKIKDKFDLVFCWGTFGHIPAYLSLEALNSFNRVLNKNGYCLLEFWIEEEKTLKIILHYCWYWTGHLLKRQFKKTFPVNCSTYTPKEIEDMVKRTNFKIIKNIRGNYLLQKIK